MMSMKLKWVLLNSYAPREEFKIFNKILTDRYPFPHFDIQKEVKKCQKILSYDETIVGGSASALTEISL